MEVLDTLALALGFATLAGINLYMTTLLTGLAIRFDWLTLADHYESLSVLGDWPVLTASAVLFIIEAAADKIPWVDSTWDAFHTLIRPIGGGLLAMGTLGDLDPAFNVIIGLLFGGTTLVSHSVKSGTRLVINASPEPVSNVVASVAEDAAVLGGLALMSVDPKITGSLCLIFLALSIWLMPRMWRRIRGFFWLLGNGVSSMFRSPAQDLMPGLAADEDLALEQAHGFRPEIHWSVPVIAGTSRGLPNLRPWTRGTLVSKGDELCFVGRRWWRWNCLTLDPAGMDVAHEPRTLSQDVVIYSRDGQNKWVFRLPGGHRDMALRVVEALRQGSPSTPPSSAGLPSIPVG